MNSDRDTGVELAMTNFFGILYVPSVLLGLITVSTLAASEQLAPVTTGTLLEEMSDLGRLAQWPQPAYRTIQFSSYDRRSTTSESPAWFSNADGFGNEPIPAFL